IVRPGGPITIKALTFRNRSAQKLADFVRPFVPQRAPLHYTSDGSGRSMIWVRVSEDDAAGVAAKLAAHPDVVWVERFMLPVLLNDDSSWLIQSGDPVKGRTVFRNGLTGYGQVVGVADSGLDADACQFRFGESRDEVTFASGIPQPPAGAKANPEGKIISYFIIGQSEAYDDAAGGFHGTHTTGNMAGDNYEHRATRTAAGRDQHDGMAPGAQIVFQDIGANDGTLRGTLGLSMYNLFDQAYRAGARIHNNSYGSAVISINYDSDSASIDAAAWKFNDFLPVFAAGNSGSDSNENVVPRSLGGTGSTAKNSLVVGASGPVEIMGMRLQNDLVVFSSQGPTRDNRLKPDVVAPGLVYSATTDNDTLIDDGCCVYGTQDNKMITNNEDNNCNVDEGFPAFGTSFSSPLVAGAAALARQYYTDGFWATGEYSLDDGFNPTNALVKATIINGATPLTGGIRGMYTTHPLDYPPSYAQGWGRVNLDDVLYFDGDERVSLVLNDTPNPVPDNPMLAADVELAPFAYGQTPIETSDEVRWQLPYLSGNGRLTITLVWSDPPGTPGALAAIVNNLDLVVIAPNDDIYIGNLEYDQAGHSQPSTSGITDMVNNVEQIIIADPDHSQTYQVRVSGYAINGNGDEGSTAQGYALLVSGEFLAPLAESIDPAVGVPDTGLANVTVSGQNFVTGMEIDLGPGISIDEVQVIDSQTALIGLLMVDPDAELGPRDLTTSLYKTLRGTATGLFKIGTLDEAGSSGCSCSFSSSSSSSTGLLSALMVLVCSIIIIRSRKL
ncbi:MAG: S8 family serine peptidase, partial [Deltaproteobacteria bacterium]|nr:S8 family serine peptidase [Deltaproteobacteria bacterium]